MSGRGALVFADAKSGICWQRVRHHKVPPGLGVSLQTDYNHGLKKFQTAAAVQAGLARLASRRRAGILRLDGGQQKTTRASLCPWHLVKLQVIGN
jgi:hypothetical protein